jgi:UDP-N-acetylglucosamine--N-acetylmuramyl-(pentapeptide) pyrophosphoryl-undecaprenol N-acetylglucosamine transferase
MPRIYAASDLVLCRSGASTLSELAICGLPAILVPYPYSAAGHQVYNAKAVEKSGAAITILEKDLEPQQLAETLIALCRDEDRLRSMSIAAKQMAKPDAAYTIVSHMEPLLRHLKEK